MVEKFIRALRIVSEPRALRALLTWGTFSFTSFSMLKALSRQNIKPRTIIDVGANVGQFTVAAHHFFPDATIYSFEPVPECFGALSRNTKSLIRVNLFNLALGDQPRELEINISTRTQASSFLRMTTAHPETTIAGHGIEKVTVDVDTLDNLKSDLTLEPPVLLKLDVQGFEAQVLDGAKETLASVDNMIVEVSFVKIYDGEPLFDEMYALVLGHGFEFVRPVGWYQNLKTDEIMQMDALFTRKQRRDVS